jgi:hypothetical protein
MKNKIFTVSNLDQSTIDWIQIDHENGEFTFMRKDIYDAQQAIQASLEAKPTK